MLQISCNQTNNTKINAVSGAILKNHPKSWFERFHLKSPRSEELFKKYSKTIILQMVMCGDMEVMAELVDRKDYEAEIEKGE